MSARADFTPSTKETLARRAGYRCSICQTPTVGPHSELGNSIFLGEASHIYSAAPNGPRANPSVSHAERASITNGIHLCKTHARLVDIDVAAYPAERLLQIKNEHEQKVRALIVGPTRNYDPDFLTSHETQVVHGRGAPSLNDLWIQRYVLQQQVDGIPKKYEATTLLSTETGIVLVSGDQSSGRTSLLKRLASNSLLHKNCVWINCKGLTESVIKDPVQLLTAGYQRINNYTEGWTKFLEAEPSENVIFLDDLHLSPLNIATRRKFLSLLQGMSDLVVASVNDPFLFELLAASSNDGLVISQWRLADLTRADCVLITENWCKFGSESIEDDKLDARIAASHDQLEEILGRRLVPRYPVVAITALQTIDAKMPLDTIVGSFGGIYDTMISLALSKDSKNMAEISNQRSYLSELAYWCETQPDSEDRVLFNRNFADLKAINAKKASELEAFCLSKGFLSRNHHGFRFNYQKHYFLASFIRDNPNRNGVREYTLMLIKNCWNEDYATTALFLAYLQPSSYLIDVLLQEVGKLFLSYPEFDVNKWEIERPFPKGFFRELEFTTDPESNRRVLAQRLDESAPTSPAECAAVKGKNNPEEDHQAFLEYLKSFCFVETSWFLGRL